MANIYIQSLLEQTQSAAVNFEYEPYYLASSGSKLISFADSTTSFLITAGDYVAHMSCDMDQETELIPLAYQRQFFGLLAEQEVDAPIRLNQQILEGFMYQEVDAAIEMVGQQYLGFFGEQEWNGVFYAASDKDYICTMNQYTDCPVALYDIPQLPILLEQETVFFADLYLNNEGLETHNDQENEIGVKLNLEQNISTQEMDQYNGLSVTLRILEGLAVMAEQDNLVSGIMALYSFPAGDHTQEQEVVAGLRTVISSYLSVSCDNETEIYGRMERYLNERISTYTEQDNGFIGFLVKRSVPEVTCSQEAAIISDLQAQRYPSARGVQYADFEAALTLFGSYGVPARQENEFTARMTVPYAGLSVSMEQENECALLVYGSHLLELNLDQENDIAVEGLYRISYLRTWTGQESDLVPILVSGSDVLASQENEFIALLQDAPKGAILVHVEMKQENELLPLLRHSTVGMVDNPILIVYSGCVVDEYSFSTNVEQENKLTANLVTIK